MTKTRQWSALTAVLAVVILAAGWFLLVSPKRSAVAALNATAVTQEQANAMVLTQIAALKAQAADLPRKQARLAEISAKLPENADLPTLVRSLTDAAGRANVDLLTVTPSAPAPLTAAVPATVGLSTPAVAVLQIPVALTVQGRFFQVEQFLSNLESMPRAFAVTSFAAVPVTGAAGATSGAATAAATGAPTAAADALTATVAAMVFTAPATAPAAATASGAAPGAAATPSAPGPAPADTTTTR